jgi:redox-sensitive bicupin YhaK (pirin superfamily)
MDYKQLTMVRIISADQRHIADYGWLKTYWLFSFSEYYDPSNIRHGSLRVFNDDYVNPNSGFPTHPHSEMEIITIVLDGEITHGDSMGNSTVIKAGEVQCMSAGTGVTHSEHNRGNDLLHLYQIWIFPRERGLVPSYDQKSFDPVLWKNKMFPVASGQGLDGAVKINADASIYRCTLEAGNELIINTSSERKIFIYNTIGKFSLNGEIIEMNDQARVSDEEKLSFRAEEDSEVIMVDSV